MKLLWQVADFARGFRRHLRFGKLSRAPLRLIRTELQGSVVECDWVLRAEDPWDADLGAAERERKISEQALRDAISLREILFASMPEIEAGVLNAFRFWAVPQKAELVVRGEVTRDTQYLFRVNSLAMQAKLYGFQFQLNHGILQPLQSERSNFVFQHSSSEPQNERRANICHQ